MYQRTFWQTRDKNRVSTDLRLHFLPRDASAERGDATVSRPSVCLSVRLSVRNV